MLDAQSNRNKNHPTHAWASWGREKSPHFWGVRGISPPNPRFLWEHSLLSETSSTDSHASASSAPRWAPIPRRSRWKPRRSCCGSAEGNVGSSLEKEGRSPRDPSLAHTEGGRENPTFPSSRVARSPRSLKLSRPFPPEAPQICWVLCCSFPPSFPLEKNDPNLWELNNPLAPHQSRVLTGFYLQWLRGEIKIKGWKGFKIP